MNELRISHGCNDLVFDEDGRAYVDLQAGFGSVLLGHANERIVRALAEQAARLWTAGHQRAAVTDAARRRVAGFLPSGHRLVDFLSTGMEAIEFAMRVAALATGRGRFAGFERGMHGKSIVTSTLCWPNEFTTLPDLVRLPYLPEQDEPTIIDRLDRTLQGHDVAALLVEPIHGSGGGWSASPEFHRALVDLCSAHGTLTIYDEVLTGFHRTGPAFCVESLGVTPDVLVMGKAMGNGFPVSAVSVRDSVDIVPRMLPGSTYANNPLAAAAVVATLDEMERVDPRSRVEHVASVVASRLGGLGEIGFGLRGRGALWIVETPAIAGREAIVEETIRNGVLLSATGSLLRLLPAATISDEHLERACEVVRVACMRAAGA